jgi:hypothetical protein
MPQPSALATLWPVSRYPQRRGARTAQARNMRASGTVSGSCAATRTVVSRGRSRVRSIIQSPDPPAAAVPVRNLSSATRLRQGGRSSSDDRGARPSRARGSNSSNLRTPVAGEAFRIGSENVRAETLHSAHTGCSAGSRYRRMTDLSRGRWSRCGGQTEIAGGQAARG